MRELLGTNNFPFFSIAIGQLLETRYFHWHVVCSAIALLHLVAEWLYFGKYPQKISLLLLVCLCAIGLVQALWLQPRLQGLHQLERRPAQHEEVARAVRASRGLAGTLDVILICGLGLYLWRVTNPVEGTRFVSAPKFRS